MKVQNRKHANAVDMFRRLAQSHGHAWAAGPRQDETIQRFEDCIITTEDYSEAYVAAMKLSDYVEDLLKDLPAPHNTGIFFRGLYHETATGRETWFPIGTEGITYQLERPAGIGAFIQVYKDGAIVAYRHSNIAFYDRHYFTVIDALLALGVNPENFPDFIRPEVWARYVKEELNHE